MLAGRLRASGSGTIRFGVDGPVEADAAALADEVAALLARDAVPVARVRAVDFLRARSLRLEYGRDDPDSMYLGWYDVPALRREVLDSFVPGGRWLPRLRDPLTDRAVRERPRDVVAGSVLVLDGRFLCRDDLRTGLDVVVHLDVSPGARTRRVEQDEAARLLPAWSTYLDDVAPAGLADVVVRFDHPDRPALVR